MNRSSDSRQWGGRGDSISLSAPRAERAGVRRGFRVVAVAHLTFPRPRRGPSLSPPEGRRGISHRPDEMCALRRGSGCARPGPTSNRSSLVWKCGLPARRGEGCGAPPRAAPARPHIAKWLPRCRELRRVRETGCSPTACRRRISCLPHAPPVAWARPDAVRWRGAGRA
jgi:hypothetical protein